MLVGAAWLGVIAAPSGRGRHFDGVGGACEDVHRQVITDSGRTGGDRGMRSGGFEDATGIGGFGEGQQGRGAGREPRADAGQLVPKGRVAALREHRGEVVGRAVWPKIIDQETWLQVKAALAERARGSNNRMQRWLTGILFCGRCGHRLTGALGPVGRPPVYRCAKATGGCGRLNIAAPASEDVVSRLVVAYLSRPDVLADLAAATSHENTQQARKDAAADEEQLTELAGMWGSRKISTKEYLAARKQIDDRLSRSKAIMRASTPPGVRALLAASDISAGWGRLTDPHDRREVARLVFTHGITVQPVVRRSFSFDAERLQPIDWRLP